VLPSVPPPPCGPLGSPGRVCTRSVSICAATQVATLIRLAARQTRSMTLVFFLAALTTLPTSLLHALPTTPPPVALSGHLPLQTSASRSSTSIVAFTPTVNGLFVIELTPPQAEKLIVPYLNSL